MNNRLSLLAIVALMAAPAMARLPSLASDDAVIAYTDKVIRLNRLSDNVGCLQYAADRSHRGAVFVDVMEIHSRTCGGDPNVSPRLFTIRYNIGRGTATTDRGSVDGIFHAIRTP